MGSAAAPASAQPRNPDQGAPGGTLDLPGRIADLIEATLAATPS